MKKQYIPAAIAGIGFIILILDAKTALSGAAEGIVLCTQTVIPSLFPFLFLSILMTGFLRTQTITPLKWLCRMLRIPTGAESLLVIGLLGGYPVGAQCVAEAVCDGSISRENGRRMLAFCSNAGPAFLFGIGSSLFPSRWMCWAIWSIHIASALIVGLLTPGGTDTAAQCTRTADRNISQSLKSAVGVMAVICGWVVLFRIVITFCKGWFLWYLPQWAQCLASGILELTNGCCGLIQITDIRIRFVLFAGLVSFGGLCVAMQTYSVTAKLDASLYLPGKICQSIISLMLASAVISRVMALTITSVLIICLTLLIFFKRYHQKRIAFCRKALYNRGQS